MKTLRADIETKDGQCDSYISYPDGKQNLPIVLFYMDAVGLRPRIYEMVDRLAAQGYYVIAPNLFYRDKRAPVVDYDSLLGNLPELFKQVMSFAAKLNPELSQSDCQSFLKFAKEQPQVNLQKIGVVGYCMGGGQALRQAGSFPSDFSAAASFHAGNLATDAEASPHRWFPKIKAEVYIGHADQDQHMPPEQIERVDQLLKAANLKYTAKVYEGSRHGWTMKDLPVYNEAGEEKHWNALLSLFERNLKN